MIPAVHWIRGSHLYLTPVGFHLWSLGGSHLGTLGELEQRRICVLARDPLRQGSPEPAATVVTAVVVEVVVAVEGVVAVVAEVVSVVAGIAALVAGAVVAAAAAPLGRS